ncbi:hypothetical protein RRG08_047853 [Elysia crispata]|uniref:Uncharacterized protein n=1 Tax=Elysia crispata TaxID=231223 RepID=A0AAE0ZWZ5_9GAST|nr:hypothetical protein RRG08_047853 [Elysia crispata]
MNLPNFSLILEKNFFPANSNSCQGLEKCREDFDFGTSGTYSYGTLSQKPATQAAWDTIYEKICSSLGTRKECMVREFVSWTCSNMTKWFEMFRSRAVGDEMCELNNKSQYRRLWSEEPNCIANSTLLFQGNTYKSDCQSTYNYTNADKMPFSERCSAVNNTRNCANQFYMENCGGITRYIFDLWWFQEFRFFQRPCLSTLLPSQHVLPPEPAGR